MFDCTLGSLCHRWSSLAQALLKSGQSSICRHCLNEVVSLLICHGPLQCVVRSSTPLLALSMGEPTSSTVNSEFRSRPQSNSDCGSPSSTMASSRALQQLLQLQRGGAMAEQMFPLPRISYQAWQTQAVGGLKVPRLAAQAGMSAGRRERAPVQVRGLCPQVRRLQGQLRKRGGWLQEAMAATLAAPSLDLLAPRLA